MAKRDVTVTVSESSPGVYKIAIKPVVERSKKDPLQARVIHGPSKPVNAASFEEQTTRKEVAQVLAEISKLFNVTEVVGWD